jgi:hypothetical protein
MVPCVMKFLWNNLWQRSLSKEERQVIANHNRTHLAWKSGVMSTEYLKTLFQISEFEKGKLCLEPNRIETCLLDLSINDESK